MDYCESQFVTLGITFYDVSENDLLSNEYDLAI